MDEKVIYAEAATPDVEVKSAKNKALKVKKRGTGNGGSKTKSVGDEKTISIFNQLMGLEAMLPDIATVKLTGLVNIASDVRKVISSMLNVPYIADSHKDTIRKWLDKCEHKLTLTSVEAMAAWKTHDANNQKLVQKSLSGEKPTDSDVVDTFRLYTDGLSQEQKTNISDDYNALRKSPVIASTIIISGRLKDHKPNIMALNPSFIQEIPGQMYLPYDEIVKMDLYSLFLEHPASVKPEMERLKAVIQLGFRAFGNITIPSVAPDAASKVIMNIVEMIRKQAPGCDLAINYIIESSDTLKNNFSAYYKDMVITDNPSSIFTNFFSDVQKNVQTKHSSILAKQFTKLLGVYKNQFKITTSGGSVSDMLFNKISKNIKILGSIGDDEPAVTHPTTALLEHKADESTKPKPPSKKNKHKKKSTTPTPMTPPITPPTTPQTPLTPTISPTSPPDTS